MPNTDVINTTGALHFEYPSWLTRLSPDSNPPDEAAHVTSELKAVTVKQSAGGQQLDHADLEWWVLSDLTNRTQPANFARMVDVLLPDANNTRIHLGDYVTEVEDVGGSEKLTGQSQMRGYHFGPMFPGQLWYDKGTPAAEVQTDEPPVFNPRIDGRILPNMSDKKNLDTDLDHYYWIHPEAGLTTASQTEVDQVPQRWLLAEAVLAMCWSCNPGEDFIENPTRAALATVLNDAPELEDVRLPLDQHLPYYLDRLLQPLGYNWFVDYDTGTVEETPTTEAERHDKNKPKIVVFKKGVGTEKELYFQAPGEVLDLDDSNCNQYRIQRRIGDSINSVKVLGDYERAEVTVELYKGWAATDDSRTAEDLDKSDPESDYEAKPTVWRLWVANEGGDYTGLRTEITEAPDFSTVFTTALPHRRELEDPFTYQGGTGKKERRQIFVEYSIDDGSTWQVVPTSFGQPFVMPDQIGIIFQGDTPPEELIDAGDDARVRVTGVIAGDSRLTAKADRQTHAVNGRDVPLVLDVPQKFRLHSVQATGDFASVLSGDSAGAETTDDTTEIEDFAEEIRDQYEIAELDSSFTLPGIHLDYKIGNVITKIAGREISLNAASATAPNPVYVQITGRSITNGPDPVTTLTVERGTRRVNS